MPLFIFTYSDISMILFTVSRQGHYWASNLFLVKKKQLFIILYEQIICKYSESELLGQQVSFYHISSHNTLYFAAQGRIFRQI